MGTTHKPSVKYTKKVEKASQFARPSKYKVILLNDDYTPMDFVVLVLRLLFFMNEEKAVKKMLEVHYQGRAVCGVYSYDVAQTKCSQVNNFAMENEHPLQCDIEPEEEG